MSRVEHLKLEEQLETLSESVRILRDKLNEHESLADSINKAFRIIHNLKSSLFLFDLNDSLKLTYLMEQHFEKLRIGEISLTGIALDLMADCVTWIGNDIYGRKNDGLDYQSMIEGLKELSEKNEASPVLLENLNLTSDEKALLRDARNSDLNIFIIEIPLMKRISREEYRDLPIVDKIGDLGMIVLQIPVYSSLEAEAEEELSLKVVFVTDKKLKDFKDPILEKAVPFDEDLYLSYRDYKILIVEDNPVASLLQKSIMSDFGVCDTVNQGEAGIELFSLALKEKSPYQIILLDLVMPGIGGTEVLKRIREMEGENNIKGLKRCKVIVSTTTKESTVLMDLFRAEADAYIYKPLTKEKITKEMKNLKLI